MHKFTKIVATVSDKRCDVEFIEQLAAAGVNVVRMNSARLEWEGFKKIVDNTRAADPRLAIMMDTKGPEIRTTVNVTGARVEFHAGDHLTFVGNPDGKTSSKVISLNYADITKAMKPGDRVLIDDGELEFTIKSIEGTEIQAVADNDGSLGPRNMGLKEDEVKNRVEEAMRTTGCTSLRDNAPFHLSGGQKKMVSIATVLSMKPDILVFDEPTSGLDFAAEAQFIGIVDRLPHTMLMSTHDMNLVSRLCTRAILMEKGSITYDGHVDTLPYPLISTL